MILLGVRLNLMIVILILMMTLIPMMMMMMMKMMMMMMMMMMTTTTMTMSCCSAYHPLVDQVHQSPVLQKKLLKVRLVIICYMYTYRCGNLQHFCERMWGGGGGQNPKCLLISQNDCKLLFGICWTHSLFMTRFIVHFKTWKMHQKRTPKHPWAGIASKAFEIHMSGHHAFKTSRTSKISQQGESVAGTCCCFTKSFKRWNVTKLPYKNQKCCIQIFIVLNETQFVRENACFFIIYKKVVSYSY